MANWRDYWDPHGDMGDPTEPGYQPEAGRLGYSGYNWQTEAEINRQRMEWQARMLRENPDDMSLGVQNPDSPHFKSPADREAEYDAFTEKWRDELGHFN